LNLPASKKFLFSVSQLVNKGRTINGETISFRTRAANEPMSSVRAIFERAIELDSEAARRAYLDEVCSGREDIREEVDALIKAHRDADSFLAEPAFSGEQTLVIDSIAERPGTVIGSYKLLEKIGEGGFGVVFMAEQEQPVRRRVALKVIKAGMDTREVIARFEAERQALALMEHPNIARVFDGGATESGRPYFVMELVRGIPITEFCDRNCLTVEERLRLFATVCTAVQHAHQKGIIHRDVKPSNVLVTLHDGVPVPKVIDFGVAKATGQCLTDKTLFTAFAQMLGTPLYMSPEQAELSGLDIDTRSDIYSLGVMLYELLTGTTPFDKTRLLKAGYDEMRRIIREEEPPKPSTRISTMGAASASISTHRKSESRKLGQLMRGELDWIVMKCLEKDRNRRYETAIALSRDVDNYLQNEPVHACPPSATYKFRKFVRRHKAAIAIVAAVLVLLVADSVISTWQAVRATRNEAAANEARIKAEADAKEARRDAKLVAEQVANDFKEGRYAKLFSAGGPQQIKSLLEMSAALNPIQSHAAWDAQIVAELRLVNGLPGGALEAIEAIFVDPPSGYPKSHFKTLGWVLLANGKKQEARAAFEKAIEPLKRTDGSYDFANATGDHLTAAYFLDLVSEEEYVQRFAKQDVDKSSETQDVNISFPWFYIGQRREIEKKRAAAVEAYKRSVGIPSRTPHPTLSAWRLMKLEESANAKKKSS
jgi:serine/threonine protein kinase/predicted negative regulator of RcsB-dependent stress response